jgi:uncharacterized protein YjbI with pentapeptide repeats
MTEYSDQTKLRLLSSEATQRFGEFFKTFKTYPVNNPFVAMFKTAEEFRDFTRIFLNEKIKTHPDIIKDEGDLKKITIEIKVDPGLNFYLGLQNGLTQECGYQKNDKSLEMYFSLIVTGGGSPRSICFSNVDLKGKLTFVDALSNSVQFQNVKFEERVNFAGLNTANALFEKVSFQELFSAGVKDRISNGNACLWNLYFRKVHFHETANFGATRFEGSVLFEDVIFDKGILFYCSIFKYKPSDKGLLPVSIHKGVEFINVNFVGKVTFDHSRFESEARFTKCSFEKIDFTDAEFLGDFFFYDSSLNNCSEVISPKDPSELTLDNAIFRGRGKFIGVDKGSAKRVISAKNTSFEGAVTFSLNFATCPDFSKTHFSQKKDIQESWLEDGEEITDIKSGDEGKFRFLKKYFTDLGDHFKEQQYFSYEMKAVEKKKERYFSFIPLKKILKESEDLCEAVRSFCKYLPAFLRSLSDFRRVFDLTLFKLYKWSSNYGRSVGRPLFFLVVSVFLTQFLRDLSLTEAAIKVARAFLEVGNTDVKIIDEPFIQCSWPGIRNLFVSVVHPIINSILLFLLGLGIRNKFRIK